MKTQLDTALQHPAYYSAYPTDIIDLAHTIFVPRALVSRLSKWCDHAGAGETDARKFTRALFRHSNELLTIPPRFLGQDDRPIAPPAAFEQWADRIIAAWGGVPNKPPAIAAALGIW
ncbi:MAG: hypothetical protein K2X38_15315 [Gemmataceae bacterium]|nr:hypothetical protein [Gemmataceae bacterium]